MGKKASIPVLPNERRFRQPIVAAYVRFAGAMLGS